MDAPLPLSNTGQFSLPGSIAIIANAPDDPRRVVVRVTANLVNGSSTLSYAQAFVPGTVTHVVFPLASRCAGAATAACPDGTICGADGCAAPQVFTGDATVPDGCPTGQSACVGGCVNLATDNNHCGACDARCANGTHCVANHCELSATCSTPTPVTLEAVTTVRGHVSFDTTHDAVGCGNGMPQTDNAYLTFTLSTPEIVALETDPSDAALRVGFVDGCASAAGSTDAGCGAPYFERLVQVRPAGPQVVVASQTGMAADVTANPGLHLLYVTSAPGATGSYVVTGNVP